MDIEGFEENGSARFAGDIDEIAINDIFYKSVLIYIISVMEGNIRKYINLIEPGYRGKDCLHTCEKYLNDNLYCKYDSMVDLDNWYILLLYDKLRNFVAHNSSYLPISKKNEDLISFVKKSPDKFEYEKYIINEKENLRVSLKRRAIEELYYTSNFICNTLLLYYENINVKFIANIQL